MAWLSRSSNKFEKKCSKKKKYEETAVRSSIKRFNKNTIERRNDFQKAEKVTVLIAFRLEIICSNFIFKLKN